MIPDAFDLNAQHASPEDARQHRQVLDVDGRSRRPNTHVQSEL